jgi:integrase
MVNNDRLPKCEILWLTKKHAAESDDHRRAMAAKEVKRLLRAIKGESHGLSAVQRFYLYQTALNIGFRAKELASLLPGDFRLSQPNPHIRVKATNTKNKKTTNQPINPVFVQYLANWIAKHTMPTERIWPGKWFSRAAEMLERDLAAAKIPLETPDGILDFHALRTTYVTNLVRAGLHPKVVKDLARHSTMELTMKIYARLGINDLGCSIIAVKPVSAPVPTATPTVRKARSKSA